MRVSAPIGAGTLLLVMAVHTTRVKDGPSGSDEGPAAVVRRASCSGRSCHGGDGGEDEHKSRSEYTRWELADPHARAYERLLGERSKEIMGRLGGGDASDEPRCLACHSSPQPGTRTHEGGTGCEGCHGPATKWLVPHGGDGWKRLSPEEKAARGMTTLADPAALASACAGCHVGATADEKAGRPTRDVTHELIAAGHPPLRFDLATYVANLPPHWEPKRRPAREAELWLADQVVSGRHAAELMAAHADEGPEFADFACYACHHSITGRGRPGKLVLASWYLGLLGPLRAEVPNGAAVGEALAGLEAARGGKVKAEAEKLAKALRVSEAGLGSVDGVKRDRLRKLLRDMPAKEMARWERAAQAYYGLDALERAEGRTGPGELLKRLAFPVGAGGPVTGFGYGGRE